MPTSGNTTVIMVNKGLASFLKHEKISTGMPIWKLIENNLTDDFIIKYNNWVRISPEAKKKNYKSIKEREDSW